MTSKSFRAVLPRLSDGELERLRVWSADFCAASAVFREGDAVVWLVSKERARSREGFDCFGKISGRADREPPGCPSQRRKSTTVFENQRKSISNIKKYTKINEFHKKSMNIEPRRVLARPWRAPAVPSERM